MIIAKTSEISYSNRKSTISRIHPFRSDPAPVHRLYRAISEAGAGMQIIPTSIEGIRIIAPKVFEDSRGFFMETYHHARYQRSDLERTFVQDNLSYSVRGTLRGLHFQIKNPQAKLIQAISGEIFDVAVDIRPGSATFGRWAGVHLSAKTRRQLFIPEGFAHGFCVLSDGAYVAYKCSEYYDPEDEGGIRWSDPAIGINWPIRDPIVSEKDRRFPFLRDLSPQQLFNPLKKL